MSNASLKDQLEAIASQLSDTLIKTQQPKRSEQKAAPVKKSAQMNKPPKKPVAVPKPKPKWLLYVQYGVELLRAYFPQTFTSGNDVKPLKKGIKQDLIKALSAFDNIATDDKACMVKSLAYYVNTAVYHKKVVMGAVRIDLEGKPAGEVSAEEAKYSVERVQAKQQAKIAKLTSSKPPVQEKIVEVV